MAATLALERRSGLSCEIVRTCARIRSLTTGTFNLVVKDRIAIRLSGANSVQSGDTQVRLRLSSKPYNHTGAAKIVSIAASHRISRCFPHREKRAAGQESEPRAKARLWVGISTARLEVVPFQILPRDWFPLGGSLLRATVWPSASRAPAFGAGLFRPYEGGRQKIEKRSYVWRFLALKAPFRSSRSLNRSPVAGTIWARHALSTT